MILDEKLFDAILKKDSLFFGFILPKHADLNSYQITEIKKNAFKSYKKLTSIDLSHNQITKIEKETFQGLINLTSINLYDNKITQIEKETFQGLNNLITIDLQQNKIRKIEKELFQGLNNLTSIYFLDKFSNPNLSFTPKLIYFLPQRQFYPKIRSTDII